MKKLFVLLMVVGMVSVANAGLVLVPPQVAPGEAINIQTDPIAASIDPVSVWIAAATGVSLDAGTLSYTGSAAAITDFSSDPDLLALAASVVGESVGRLDLVELQDLAVPAKQVTGLAAAYGVLGDSGLGAVYMLDFDMAQVMGKVDVVPEPVTITLLGLGGLLLRRRK